VGEKTGNKVGEKTGNKVGKKKGKWFKAKNSVCDPDQVKYQFSC